MRPKNLGLRFAWDLATRRTLNQYGPRPIPFNSRFFWWAHKMVEQYREIKNEDICINP